MAQGLHRGVRPKALHETDERIEHDGDHDRQRVDQLADQARNDGGDSTSTMKSLNWWSSRPAQLRR